MDSGEERTEAKHECVLGRCKKIHAFLEDVKTSDYETQAKPTLTHMVLAKLVQTEKVIMCILQLHSPNPSSTLFVCNIFYKIFTKK